MSEKREAVMARTQLNIVQEVLRFASRGSPTTIEHARSLIEDAGAESGTAAVAAIKLFDLSVKDFYPQEPQGSIPADDMSEVFERAIDRAGDIKLMRRTRK